VGEHHTRGHSRPSLADLSSDSGWVTTDVAAKAVRVSPRTIRRYIDQGKLEAKPQGEGVRREWLVSVDSLHALRASRTTGGDVPDVSPGVESVGSIADVVREMAARLESSAEEAAELRVRLELTERAQSTLEDERRQAVQELEQERRRRGEAEREREDLRQQLNALTDERESPQTVEEEPERAEEPHPAAGEAQEDVQKPQEKRSWWRRLLGGG
jgi:chromosome segregation ATPase